VLPGVTLATIPMAVIARLSRSSMLEVLSQDYIRTARAKGLPEHRVILVHALRNALIPIITVIGNNFAVLLTGAVLTETVFSWPGLGRTMVEAISQYDYPIVLGGVIIMAGVFVLVNLIVDLTYGFIDPRVRAA
jgi:dipeptide transport system permease protein